MEKQNLSLEYPPPPPPPLKPNIIDNLYENRSAQIVEIDGVFISSHIIFYH